MIHRYLEDRLILKILIHEDGIVRDTSTVKPIRSRQVLPTLSLDTILRDHNRTLRSPYHKIRLALNLSYTLSRMYHDEISSGWTSQDILFLFNQDDCVINQAYNPYVLYSLSQPTHYGDSELASTRKFSLLIALGKLLIEIALERILEDCDLDFYPRADVALLAIIEEQEEEIVENVPSGYVEAIEACLQANRNDDYDEESDDGEELDEEIQIQEVLKSVIENLEKSRTVFLGKKLEQKPEYNNPNFPKELKVSRSVLKQTTFQRGSQPQKLRHENSLLASDIANDASADTLGQLFDGKKDCITSTDEK